MHIFFLFLHDPENQQQPTKAINATEKHKIQIDKKEQT